MPLDTLAGLADVVEQSAAPARCRVVLERLVAAHDGLADRLAADRALLDAIVAVAGISNSLTRVLEADQAALDVLADLARRPPVDASSPDALVRWKQRDLLRIAARDQLGIDELEAVGAALSRCATDVATGTLELVDAADRLAVVGMGKLGGRELNYASDVDVLFVCADDDDPVEVNRLARDVLRIAGRCFRVDANLRPEGRNGPLVRTMSSYATYWREWAEPWEFQALLKAEPVAGPPAVAGAFRDAAASTLWSRSFSADDLRSLRTLKARAEAEIARRGLTDREVKRGPGGIRDVEFSVQLLQLVHGRVDTALRSPNTLEALAELGSAGYIDDDDATEMAEAYRFLRDVEHRLQLVEEHAVYAVPAAPDARLRLARALGFRDTPQAGATELLDTTLAHRKARVRSIHERLYFRPLLEAFAGTDSHLSAEAAEARLAAFGFRDASRTREAVRELTRGLTRSSRLMQQLLPLLLQWLADTPDPDLGLLGLRTLAAGSRRTGTMVQAFRESPEVARRLCVLLGTSHMLGDHLHHNPDLATTLADDTVLAPRSREALLDEARRALAWRTDPALRQQGLHRFTDREGFRIEAADVLGQLDTPDVGRALTRLAEAALEAALEATEPQVPFAVVALGRFGGAELSYASDLDVVFTFAGDHPADVEEAHRVSTALLQFVGGPTPARRIYRVDADLRPEGKSGPLARTIDGFATYFERWALAWERQAFTRARAVAGDAALAESLLRSLAPFVWDAPLTDDDIRELRRIKARVERERIPPGEDPQFHLKLGRGSLADVEWTAQLLQLRHSIRATGTMEALGALEAAGHLAPADRADLEASYRFCERTRNRWHLVNGQAGDALPSQPDKLARLARSLDTTPVALREEYRRLTRRARRVVERVFYGQR